MSDLATARFNMVESQIRTNDVTDVRILTAMRELPREAFLPSSMRDIAYMDDDIPLMTEGQHGTVRYLMSPLSFSKVLQLADIRKSDLILDVGCATGYSTAVLARLGDSVVGLECDDAFAGQASKTLEMLGVDNAAIVTGALVDGYANEGPYDVIVLNGSVPEVPELLLKQLKDGGRLLAIIGNGGLGKLCVFNCVNGEISKRAVFDAGAEALPGFEIAPVFAL